MEALSEGVINGRIPTSGKLRLKFPASTSKELVRPLFCSVNNLGERSSTKRSPFGHFRSPETYLGLETDARIVTFLGAQQFNRPRKLSVGYGWMPIATTFKAIEKAIRGRIH